MHSDKLTITTMPAAPITNSPWKRVLPLVILGSALAAIYASGLHTYLSFEQLRLHRGELTSYVAAMPVQAVLLFIAAYAIATALSLPGG
ncbi:MAG: hypothetical protein ACKVP7_09415, partial [Hyphomicrobiaceae bacterium]